MGTSPEEILEAYRMDLVKAATSALERQAALKNSQPPTEEEHSQSLMEPTITRVTSGGTSDPDAPQTHQEGRQEASQGEAPGDGGAGGTSPGARRRTPPPCHPAKYNSTS